MRIVLFALAFCFVTHASESITYKVAALGPLEAYLRVIPAHGETQGPITVEFRRQVASPNPEDIYVRATNVLLGVREVSLFSEMSYAGRRGRSYRADDGTEARVFNAVVKEEDGTNVRTLVLLLSGLYPIEVRVPDTYSWATVAVNHDLGRTTILFVGERSLLVLGFLQDGSNFGAIWRVPKDPNWTAEQLARAASGYHTLARHLIFDEGDATSANLNRAISGAAGFWEEAPLTAPAPIPQGPGEPKAERLATYVFGERGRVPLPRNGRIEILPPPVPIAMIGPAPEQYQAQPSPELPIDNVDVYELSPRQLAAGPLLVVNHTTGEVIIVRQDTPNLPPELEPPFRQLVFASPPGGTNSLEVLIGRDWGQNAVHVTIFSNGQSIRVNPSAWMENRPCPALFSETPSSPPKSTPSQ